MTTVRIYQPIKSAMQSGRRKTNYWLVTFESRDPLLPEPLMGWVASKDMLLELHLSFPTLGKAIDFAKLKGFQYTIYNPTSADVVPKSYGLNFTCPRIRGT